MADDTEDDSLLDTIADLSVPGAKQVSKNVSKALSDLFVDGVDIWRAKLQTKAAEIRSKQSAEEIVRMGAANTLASGMTTSFDSHGVLELCSESKSYAPSRVNLLMWSHH